MSDVLTKIKSTADILGGEVFFANDFGQDPEYEGAELLPNGMYIRLIKDDGNVVYVSAHEIDKAIGIIGQMSMSKANQSDVDAIVELLDEKVSKTEIELLRTDIADKVSDDNFNDLAGQVSNKADKTDVESLIDQVSNKADKTDVELLRTSLNSKASNDAITLISEDINNKALEISRIKNDILTIQNALESVTDSNSISALQKQINYLNSELNKKLEIDDLDSLKTSIINLSTSDSVKSELISDIETNLNKKASTVYVQGQVNELNKAITGISARVDTKADKEIVAKKAAKADLDLLTSKITSLTNEFNTTKNEFESLNNTVITEINNKVSNTQLESEVSRLEHNINEKLNSEEYNIFVGRIENKIENVKNECDEDHDFLLNEFSTLQCDVNNALAETNAKSNAQLKQIELHSEQITSLKKKDIELAEKLKTQWVRVMTPEEYNSLAPINENNPFAKQPNVVYMLVRYNKPIAIYIGDILIAKAEQKGSVGFTYTFPIVF